MNRDETLVLIIDVQEKLLPMIDEHAALVDAARLLVRGAGLFGVPVVATEQYPKGIGHTDAGLAAVLNDTGVEILEKMSFSCCGDDAVVHQLRESERRRIVIGGIEAHVCVQQTALDLHALGWHVAVCADAVGSRSRIDYVTALERMRQVGIVITTVESVLFELCVKCGTSEFKKMSALIKEKRAIRNP